MGRRSGSRDKKRGGSLGRWVAGEGGKAAGSAPAYARWAAALEAGTRKRGTRLSRWVAGEGGRGGWQSGGQRTGLCQVGRHSGAREKGVQEHWQAGGREAGECYGRCRGQPRAAGTLLLQRRLHPKLPKKDRKKGEKDAHRGRDLRKPDAPRAPPAPPATTPSCQPTTPVGPRMPALTLG